MKGRLSRGIVVPAPRALAVPTAATARGHVVTRTPRVTRSRREVRAPRSTRAGDVCAPRVGSLPEIEGEEARQRALLGSRQRQERLADVEARADLANVVLHA